VKTSTEQFTCNGKTITVISSEDESGEIKLQVCSENHDEAVRLLNLVKNNSLSKI